MHQHTESSPRNFADRAKNLAAGVGLLGAVAGGAALSLEGPIDLEHTLSIVSDNAKPSDALATTFDILVLTGAAAGASFLTKRGLHHLRLVANPEDSSLYKIALADSAKSKLGRYVSATSLLTIGAGTMAGNYIDIAQAVSHTQSNVAKVLTQSIGTDSGVVISNSPKPEILFRSELSPKVTHKLAPTDTTFKPNFMPVRMEWRPGYRPGAPDAKIEMLAIGLPPSITKLPESAPDCSNVQVNVAKEMGVHPGHKFNLDGLEVTVREAPAGIAGFNLLPVIMNDGDFARCVDNNPNEPYSFLLGNKSMAETQAILRDAGVDGGDLSNRVFVVPTDEFVHEALQTGKNAVNGLVLESMLLGLTFGGVALKGRVRNDMQSNKLNNDILRASGFSKTKLAKLYAEKAEADAIRSSAFAAPIILLLDTATNLGEPGAALGPSAKTYLCVLGLTWGIKRLGSAVSIRKETTSVDDVGSQQL